MPTRLIQKKPYDVKAVAPNVFPFLNSKIRKYQQQLVELDKEIEDAQMEVDIVYPFVGGARIDHIIAAQEKAKQKAHLNQLLAKRREIEVNLSLIQDYVKKATR